MPSFMKNFYFQSFFEPSSFKNNNKTLSTNDFFNFSLIFLMDHFLIIVS